jgi:putative hydrolase
MSEFPGGADFFGRIPLFREFARLLAGESGPVNWELARQVAVATAVGADAFGAAPALPRPAPAPSPGERREWDERLRLAELWIDPVTSLAGRGLTLSARPVSRPDWAELVLPELAPLVEPGARRLTEALRPEAGATPDEMGEVMGRLGSLLAGLQIGGLVGQLAQLVLAQYDLGLPSREPARILVLPENVAEFERAAGLPADQFRLWLAGHEVVRQRVLAGVPWLADHLNAVVAEIARETNPDPSGLIDRLQSMNLGGADDLREILEGGQGLLGPPTAALEAAVGKLEAVLAITEGYALTVCERALAGRLPALGAITAAVERRLADPDGPQALFAGLMRVDPERAGAARGLRFCREVLAATDIEGLDRLWAHADFLPNPEELSVPGRWLERSGLVGGIEVDLDEGLRTLLEEEGAAPADEKPEEPQVGDEPDDPKAGGKDQDSGTDPTA